MSDYKQDIHLYIKENPNFSEKDLFNSKLRAIYQASTSSLKVSTGAEAIGLLIQSERIQGDLEEALSKNDPDFNIVVREFRDFKVEHEFRLFVYNKKITAITQYNQMVFFPNLLGTKDQLEEQIQLFFNNKLKDQIDLNNYVVDFVLCSEETKGGQGSQLKPFVIEINPFAEFAGSGLFSWIDDLDILTGKTKLQFRIVETPLNQSQVMGQMNPEWIQFLGN